MKGNKSLTERLKKEQVTLSHRKFLYADTPYFVRKSHCLPFL